MAKMLAFGNNQSDSDRCSTAPMRWANSFVNAARRVRSDRHPLFVDVDKDTGAQPKEAAYSKLPLVSQVGPQIVFLA
jgi:hypothetical protein